MTISSSKLFTVRGDRPQSLIWEGHGFELHLPEGTCPPDKDCDVMVDCVVGGEFVFPKGVEPVSAIYLISAPLKPHKSPLLKIQHSVALNKASKNACLSFYRASLKESRPPYQFRRVKGGTFDTHNQFGELHLPAFCGMAIGNFPLGAVRRNPPSLAVSVTWNTGFPLHQRTVSYLNLRETIQVSYLQ